MNKLMGSKVVGEKASVMTNADTCVMAAKSDPKNMAGSSQSGTPHLALLKHVTARLLLVVSCYCCSS